jgi:hypothetical protein
VTAALNASAGISNLVAVARRPQSAGIIVLSILLQVYNIKLLFDKIFTIKDSQLSITARLESIEDKGHPEDFLLLHMLYLHA